MDVELREPINLGASLDGQSRYLAVHREQVFLQIMR